MSCFRWDNSTFSAIINLITSNLCRVYLTTLPIIILFQDGIYLALSVWWFFFVSKAFSPFPKCIICILFETPEHHQCFRARWKYQPLGSCWSILYQWPLAKNFSLTIKLFMFLSLKLLTWKASKRVISRKWQNNRFLDKMFLAKSVIVPQYVTHQMQTFRMNKFLACRVSETIDLNLWIITHQAQVCKWRTWLGGECGSQPWADVTPIKTKTGSRIRTTNISKFENNEWVISLLFWGNHWFCGLLSNWCYCFCQQ